jgi:hypothetical protein
MLTTCKIERNITNLKSNVKCKRIIILLDTKIKHMRPACTIGQRTRIKNQIREERKKKLP